MRRIFILVVISAFLAANGFGQETLKIGTINDGKLTITNEKALNAFFLTTLENSGTLGKEYKSSASPTSDRFFVSKTVTGNRKKITSIGVMLVNRNNEALVVAGSKEEGDSSGPGGGVGGSMSVQCVGDPCTQCYPTVTWPAGQWYPSVVCHCSDDSGVCNMVMTIVFNVTIGTN